MQLSQLIVAQERMNQCKPIERQERSALTTALLFEDYDDAKTLIDQGAHIDEQDKNIICGPFLDWSIENNECGFVRLLDEIKAIDLSRVFPDGTTALHSAVKHRAPNVLRYLVGRQKVDLNQQRRWRVLGDDNSIGFTALHYAINQHDMSAAQLLIDAGADATIKDQNGKIAYDYAENSEMKEPDNEEIFSEELVQESGIDYKKEKSEVIADFKEVFAQESYPFLEENFRAFNLDFKTFIIQLLDDEEVINSVSDYDTDDVSCLFHDFIGKAEEKLAQQLAIELSTKSIDSIMHQSILNHVGIVELALHENQDELLKKLLTNPCDNKVLKSLFVDTGLIHSLPVLYHATDLSTLSFLVDHGAGQKESPKNFHAYVYINKLPKKEIQKTLKIDNELIINYCVNMIDERLDMILLSQNILTLGLSSLAKDKDYKRRKMDAIVLEAKITSKNKVDAYLKKREYQERDRVAIVVICTGYTGCLVASIVYAIIHVEHMKGDHYLFCTCILIGLISRSIALYY